MGAAREVLRRAPDFSIERFIATQHYKHEKDREHHRAALVKAQLPALISKTSAKGTRAGGPEAVDRSKMTPKATWADRIFRYAQGRRGHCNSTYSDDLERNATRPARRLSRSRRLHHPLAVEVAVKVKEFAVPYCRAEH